MAFVFGKNFTFHFFPLEDDSPAEIPSTLQTQTPSIWVFDSRPSQEAAADGTGALGNVIDDWEFHTDSNGFSFEVPAISDPNPGNPTSSKTYYVAINFLLEENGEPQTVIRAVVLERVTGHHTSVSVTENDLRTYYPNLPGTSPQRKAFIAQALEEVKSRLRAAGYEWSKIHRPDRLNMVVTLKALAMVCLAATLEQGDRYFLKYQEFKASYEAMLESLQFEYDADGDGEPDTEVQGAAGGPILLLR